MSAKPTHRTWNANESGLLWERLWGRDEDGYYARLVYSGVFTSLQRFASRQEFEDAYRAEAVQFYGSALAASTEGERHG